MQYLLVVRPNKIVMGRKSNTDQRRQQIIDALQHEMAADGYERTSIKSIAASAKLAPGLVHYHFKSKQEILLALVDQLIDQANAELKTILDSDITPAMKLATFVSSRVGTGHQSNPTLVKAWLSIMGEAVGQTKVRTRVSHWIDADQQLLEALLKEAGANDAKERASAVLAAIVGSFSLFAMQTRNIPFGYAERQILKMLA